MGVRLVRPVAPPVGLAGADCGWPARHGTCGTRRVGWCGGPSAVPHRTVTASTLRGNDQFTCTSYLLGMTTYVLRVWVPDRPGALGAVASRIGAVRGDLVGIDILERGAGRAIDELLVELPGETLVPLLDRRGVSGRRRRRGGCPSRPRLAGRSPSRRPGDGRGARRSAERGSAPGCPGVPCEQRLPDRLGGDRRSGRAGARWSASGRLRPVPGWPPSWPGAGRRSRPRRQLGGPDDVAWAELEAAELVLVLGRRGRPFRARERRQLAAVARIASARWMELVTRSSRLVHPSAVPPEAARRLRAVCRRRPGPVVDPAARSAYGPSAGATQVRAARHRPAPSSGDWCRHRRRRPRVSPAGRSSSDWRRRRAMSQTPSASPAS